MSETTAPRPGRGAILRRWWLDLQPSQGRPGDRAGLARLRRAPLLSAMMEEATLGLFTALGDRDPARLPRVAVAACLLAHVREDEPGRSFARAIGRPLLNDADGAVVKRLRFQRLVEALDDEEILRGFRRALNLAGGRADVADLGKLVLDFDKEEARRRFAFDYYAAGLATPA